MKAKGSVSAKALSMGLNVWNHTSAAFLFTYRGMECVLKQPSTAVWLAPVEIFPWQQTPAAAEELYLNPRAQ